MLHREHSTAPPVDRTLCVGSLPANARRGRPAVHGRCEEHAPAVTAGASLPRHQLMIAVVPIKFTPAVGVPALQVDSERAPTVARLWSGGKSEPGRRAGRRSGLLAPALRGPTCCHCRSGSGSAYRRGCQWGGRCQCRCRGWPPRGRAATQLVWRKPARAVARWRRTVVAAWASRR